MIAPATDNAVMEHAFVLGSMLETTVASMFAAWIAVTEHAKMVSVCAVLGGQATSATRRFAHHNAHFTEHAKPMLLAFVLKAGKAMTVPQRNATRAPMEFAVTVFVYVLMDLEDLRAR
jgi:hypothetical protein